MAREPGALPLAGRRPDGGPVPSQDRQAADQADYRSEGGVEGVASEQHFSFLAHADEGFFLLVFHFVSLERLARGTCDPTDIICALKHFQFGFVDALFVLELSLTQVLIVGL